MKRFFQYLILLIAILSRAKAQPYIEGGKTRHRFAQLNVGIDQRYFNNSHTQTVLFNTNGLIENAKLQDVYETRLIIGGTHFGAMLIFILRYLF